ncbi:hypothetical protein GH714_028914 [Hevea brasiliensis]|uniref:Retrotransposon gag domain-containing protein n=1 Tax=Hevea brasiliensis TaxID=3981 RepID=A0A6A6KJH2_HEVBR|nr:hypothetical protein GH714_028914 [Hevea brasiliensis]
MEGRVDSVEKNITDLQKLVSIMKLEKEQRMSSFQAAQDQRLSRIESLISSMAQGKSTVQEVNPSLHSPAIGTSTVHPVTPPAVVDVVGTSTLYPATQPVVVDDSSLAIKKVELSNFDGLTLELLHRYGEDMRINPYEHLSTLRQDSSVDAYIDAFVAFVSQIEGLFDQQHLGFFLSGLRDDIRVRIHSQDSTDIFRTMTLARELELENQFILQSTSQQQSTSQPKRWNDSGIRWSPSGSGSKIDMGKQSYEASVVTKTQPISSISKLQELLVQKFPDHNTFGPPKLALPSTTTKPPRPSSTFSRN